MSISVANTSTNLSGKTLLAAERDNTITGQQSFNRAPSAPFVVQAGSAVVSNLDADKVDGKHSTDFLLLDGTQAMTAGIAFPAVQNASTGANTLDDYEEGSWTPALAALTSGTITLTSPSNSGRYVKVGKLVFASVLMTVQSVSAPTGILQLTGLPFTAEDVSTVAPAVSILATGLTGGSCLMGHVIPNGAGINFYDFTAGNIVATLAGNVQAASVIYITAVYRATA